MGKEEVELEELNRKFTNLHLQFIRLSRYCLNLIREKYNKRRHYSIYTVLFSFVKNTDYYNNELSKLLRLSREDIILEEKVKGQLENLMTEMEDLRKKIMEDSEKYTRDKSRINIALVPRILGREACENHSFINIKRGLSGINDEEIKQKALAQMIQTHMWELKKYFSDDFENVILILDGEEKNNIYQYVKRIKNAVERILKIVLNENYYRQYIENEIGIINRDFSRIRSEQNLEGIELAQVGKRLKKVEKEV